MAPALLLIDVQKGIDESKHWGGSRNNPEAEGHIQLLLTFWREKRFPVFLIQHCSNELLSPLRAGQSGNDFKDLISPATEDIVIQKTTTSAFIHTRLESELMDRDIDTLYIAGFVTNNSVEATGRMAGELGFKTTIISDATACFNKPGLDGTVFSSELIHQISLANLSGEYARICSTREVMEELSS
jgi:nicotinamidase-related amidase